MGTHASRTLPSPAVIQLTGLSRSITCGPPTDHFLEEVSLGPRDIGCRNRHRELDPRSPPKGMKGCSCHFSAHSDLACMRVFSACSNCRGMCERLKQAVLKTAGLICPAQTASISGGLLSIGHKLSCVVLGGHCQHMRAGVPFLGVCCRAH